MEITPLFSTPLMQVQLDFDLEKLTEFVFHIQEKDPNGVQKTNMGGYHSDYINEEKHEEFIGLKKEINLYLQIYHSKVFREMVFKGNVIQNFGKIWVNINEKYHYNEWHIHPFSCLSGSYYIKHDGSSENGNILFKNPRDLYLSLAHWPEELVETYNIETAGHIKFTPKSNMLLIFPSWLEHKAEINLKNDSRISLSFNSVPIVEKKS